MGPVMLMVEASAIELLALFGLPSLMSMFFQWIFSRISKKKKKEIEENECAREEVRILKKGVTSLLRDKLRKNYMFYKSRGYAEVFDKENFHEMYLSYHGLGGNGMIDKMYAEVMNMPVSSEENDHK